MCSGTGSTIVHAAMPGCSLQPLRLLMGPLSPSRSLRAFTYQAVTEKTRSSRDLAVRGAIVHNIASCLHHLGELEAAQATSVAAR
eukprot:4643870-Pleurochrysis_carterae.AAC.2